MRIHTSHGHLLLQFFFRVLSSVRRLKSRRTRLVNALYVCFPIPAQTRLVNVKLFNIPSGPAWTSVHVPARRQGIAQVNVENCCKYNKNVASRKKNLKKMQIF